MLLAKTEKMYDEMAKATGNKVYCPKCGKRKTVDAKKCLRQGWPECCGETMTLERRDRVTPNVKS